MHFQTEISQYRPLADLLTARQAVVFCGAGISLEPPAGLPDWHKLRDGTPGGDCRQRTFSRSI